ncbi:MAG TPA: DNA polymerase IV [Treponema sp.]|nr:DNA polymerase IV [Treponema sp.]
MQKVFFHIDLDAFFASVEQLDHPEYKGKPVIIGGKPGDRRCVVSTASYEARAFGVHSAMPLVTAVQLCPHAIFLRGNMERYHELSQKVMNIFHNYSPDVRQMSIDEAFLDMTGTERLFGPAENTAQKIKDEVFSQTGLTVSIGVAQTMYISKIASGYKKPDGLTLIAAGTEEDFMCSLPLEKVWGVGTKTLEHIRSAGIRTSKQLHDQKLNNLIALFGNNTGTFLYEAMRGNKDMTFGEEAKNHSISSESTYEFDLTDIYTIESALMQLSQTVLWRMHEENVRSRTVALKIRYEDFTTVSIQETQDIPVRTADDLFERSKKLFEKKYERGRGIRLLGLSVEHVESRDTPFQGQLFDDGNTKKSKVEDAIFSMQKKNPELSLRKARLLNPSGQSKGAK